MDRYTCALDAKHHCEKFVCQGKRVGQRIVVRNQQPSTATLVDMMQPIARGSLRD
jgi:hypothetical protein